MQPTQSSVNYEEIKKTLIDKINESEHLQSLKSHPGFLILQEILTSTVKKLTKDLKVEVEVDKFRRIQSDLLAFESLSELIESSFIDAEVAKSELEKLDGLLME